MSAPKVYIAEDDEVIVAMLSRSLKREGYEVRGAQSVRGLVDKIRTWSPDVVMLDISLVGGSGLDVLREVQDRGVDTEVVMLTADDTAATAIKALKMGAADYLTKPFDVDEVKVVLGKLVEQRRLKREVDYLRREGQRLPTAELIGSSARIAEVRDKAARLAEAGVDTVLLTGESGTGKEVVARLLHCLRYGTGGSADAPFVAVNCAAFPANLIEDELFGHEKGAFTDARTEKKGVFELAQGGSLLLDEIGEMPLNLQAKLLRVLETRTVRRIAGREDLPVQVTVIASTNLELEQAAGEGSFRSDLFYRLNAFALHLPPLRERERDVLELAQHFLARLAHKYRKKKAYRLSQAAERLFLSYPWPGNVRELRNVVERVVVLEDTDVVEPRHLPQITAGGEGGTQGRGGFALPPAGIDLEEVKRDLIVQALEQADHNRAQAARLLGLSYDTLRYQLKKYGLE